MLPQLRRQTEWLIVCDLDEFVYARNGFQTIRDYLLSLPDSVTCVQIPWKIFGSSGFDRQPEGGVAQNFLYRYCYTRMPKHYYGWYYGKIPCKYIVRPAAASYLGCHRADLLYGLNQLANGEAVQPSNWHYTSEAFLEQACLHINHYALQSQEFFLNTKMQRGGGVTPREKRNYSLEWFRKYDVNDLKDDELALKRSALHAAP